MPLKEGTRLGPYEVLAPIGAGGMGEVYRARDTRLDRTVAIKVLPADASESDHRRKRLEREARAISQLSHPNICALYDLGHQDGIDYLVMEHLDGETLADRLRRRGALPLDRALEHGIEIAAALDEAHRRGVTHRDLKPGNVMLTATGAKLLDFGLAKLAGSRESVSGPLTAAPTRDEPLTAEGALVGTFRYMAPEQLEGREADARTDLWALGLVLHEMVTGAGVFEATSQAGLIAAILERDPASLATLRPEAPAALDRLVRRCLAKDPDERWQSARDVLLELRWVREAGADALVAPPRRRGILLPATLLALAAALVTTAIVLRSPEDVPPRPVRFSLDLPENADPSSVRVSPDGRLLSFRAESNGRPHLWLRSFDSLDTRPLPGTEGAQFFTHCWSPDSRFIAFMAGGKVKKIDVRGGRPQVLADAPGAGPFQLVTWSKNGTIVYNISESPEHAGLYRVSADGGPAERLTLLDEAGNEVDGDFPSFLPDGRHFLLYGGTEARDGIWLASLDTLRARRLSETGSYAQYVPPGYLLYVVGGSLMAHPFDADGLRFRGEPLRVAERVETLAGFGVPSFSASRGVLAYYSGQYRPSRLVWRDRTGRELGSVGGEALYGSLRLSPDAKRLLVSIGDAEKGTRDLWLMELGRDVVTRMTSSAADGFGPVWSPDGSRAVVSIPVDAPPSLHLLPFLGGAPEPLLPSGTLQWASDWSADRRLVFYANRDPDRRWDIWMLPIDEGREPSLFLGTPYSELDAQLSPDGRLVAFISDESGEHEVYVVPFDRKGEKRRISTGGGWMPRWRRDGLELFYLGGDNRLMAVPVTLEGGFEPGTPEALFAIDPGDTNLTAYDVTGDGRRFLVNSATAGAKPVPTVVLNWTSGLAQ